MIAVQYNTVKQKPTERDTRDLWEIREELAKEKKQHSNLLEEIRSSNEVIQKYEATESTSPEIALNETINNLKHQIGLTEVVGPGLTIRIELAEELILMGYEIEEVSPDLLVQLINEIFMYNGIYMEIDGTRVVQTTAIRDINGQTTVNSIPLRTPPIEIRVGTSSFENAQKLYNHLMASSFMDSFYLDNFKLSINEPIERLKIKAYDNVLKNSYLTEKGD